jgi:mono/diheme cytochrome c family protein
MLLVALVLLLGLAACGGGDDDEAGDEPTATATDGATTDGATTDGATTDGATTDGATTGGATTDGATTGEDDEGGDAEAGAEVWAEAGCGSCHVLAAASSSGSIGPDLDEASPSFDKVVERVTEGSGAMPSFRDQLSEGQIRDVAAYVSTSVDD